MCTTCGCGTKTVNADNNYGTVNPYGIPAPEVNKPTTLGQK
jgi:hypothetical protein